MALSKRCAERMDAHQNILQASQNEVLLRVCDSLAVDRRIRGVIGMISLDFPDVVESHRPIVDALEKGLWREAGLLLRNHVERAVEFLKKSESESEFKRVLRNDLEDAKEVHRAFFPRKNPSTLIANVHRLVPAAFPRHLYASLFYAEYEVATRILRYVNAGHNAAIVLRRKLDQPAHSRNEIVCLLEVLGYCVSLSGIQPHQ